MDTKIWTLYLVKKNTQRIVKYLNFLKKRSYIFKSCVHTQNYSKIKPNNGSCLPYIYMKKGKKWYKSNPNPSSTIKLRSERYLHIVHSESIIMVTCSNLISTSDNYSKSDNINFSVFKMFYNYIRHYSGKKWNSCCKQEFINIIIHIIIH